MTERPDQPPYKVANDGATAAKAIATGKSTSGLGSAILNHDILCYRKYTVTVARTLCARTTVWYSNVTICTVVSMRYIFNLAIV
jgi:hypothetical protein